LSSSRKNDARAATRGQQATQPVRRRPYDSEQMIRIEHK
jgi:hypothetical protein